MAIVAGISVGIVAVAVVAAVIIVDLEALPRKLFHLEEIRIILTPEFRAEARKIPTELWMRSRMRNCICTNPKKEEKKPCQDDPEQKKKE